MGTHHFQWDEVERCRICRKCAGARIRDGRSCAHERIARKAEQRDQGLTSFVCEQMSFRGGCCQLLPRADQAVPRAANDCCRAEPLRLMRPAYAAFPVHATAPLLNASCLRFCERGLHISLHCKDHSIVRKPSGQGQSCRNATQRRGTEREKLLHHEGLAGVTVRAHELVISRTLHRTIGSRPTATNCAISALSNHRMSNEHDRFSRAGKRFCIHRDTDLTSSSCLRMCTLRDAASM